MRAFRSFLWSVFLTSSLVSSMVRRRAEDTSSCSLECHIVWPEIMLEDGSGGEDIHSGLVCMTQLPGRSYRQSLAIDLPSTFLADRHDAIETGRLHLCITHGTVQNGSVILSPDSELSVVEESDRRRLQTARKGRKRLLAVRVTTPSGEEPDESVDLIEGTIFGTGSSSVSPSVVSQYLDISHGQLEYVPATGRNINYGVLEIEINTRVLSGKDIQESLTDDLLNRTAEAIGSIGDTADNIIFCLPTGSIFQKNPEWTAFTYLFEPYSYYQQSRCTRLSVAVHELGHSIGFQHSGFGDNIYADKTGYMGYAVNKVGTPRKSFNGHKHWLSGWFTDRTYILNPRTESTGLRLASFVDYSDPNLGSDDYILVRVGNMFIQYNLAQSYNEDADEPNTVTVTEAVGQEEVSVRLAGLSSGESYVVYDGSNRIFVVEVCAIRNTVGRPPYAFVSIHRDRDGSQCGEERIPTVNGNVVTDQGAVDWESLLNPQKPTNAPFRAPTRAPIFIATSPVQFPQTQNVPTAFVPATNMPTLSPRNVASPFKPSWKNHLIIVPVAIASGALVCFCLVLAVFLHFCNCRSCGKGSGSVLSHKTDRNSSTSSDDSPNSSSGNDASSESSAEWWETGGEYLADLGCIPSQE